MTRKTVRRTPTWSGKEGRGRFLTLLRAAVDENSLVKLTLSRYRGSDKSLRNVFIRPVTLASGPHLSFVWRHATRDVTKNHAPAAALTQIETLIGGDFLDAHLFTPGQSAQLECRPNGFRLRLASADAAPSGPAKAAAAAPTTSHDRAKVRVIPADAPWLCALGVTNDQGRPRAGMTGKFRQIQKFAELAAHLTAEAALGDKDPLSIVDMGCGKGYLTFAVSTVLGPKAHVLGIETRPDLVGLCNRIAAEQGFSTRLAFAAGTIEDTPWKASIF